MKTYRLLAPLALVAATLSTQGAWSNEVHHRQILPGATASPANTETLAKHPELAPPPALIGLFANLTQSFPTLGANADGSDVWPCFGRGNNPDCAMIGNPPVPLPRGGIVMGRPAFVWALQNNDVIGFGIGNGVGCDALTNGTVGQIYEGVLYRPCGQIFTSYEDDTGDSTDDLLQRIVVTQGTRIIYDSGVTDFGPAGPITYPVDVALYNDINFGYWPGAQDGPNNGNCSGNVGYPLTAPAFPQGTVYQIASNSTCQQPVAGPATFTTYTELATPEYKQVTGKECTSKGVASPCFTVKFSRRYLIHQNFDIFLQ
jgi:hypothetical protein